MLTLTFLHPLLTTQAVILKNDLIFRGSPASEGSLESNEKRQGPYFWVPVPNKANGTLLLWSCSHYSWAEPEGLWGQWVASGPVFFQSQPSAASEAQKSLCKVCASKKESPRRRAFLELVVSEITKLSFWACSQLIMLKDNQQHILCILKTCLTGKTRLLIELLTSWYNDTHFSSS